MFDNKKKHQLKKNPTKSFLRVSTCKFLRFVVTSSEIHLDLDKVKAIQGMQPSWNLKELRVLYDRLAYIRRFIANLSGWYQLFMKLMKTGVSFIWDEACQQVFKDIKDYLTKSPVLMLLVSGKPFLVYVQQWIMHLAPYWHSIMNRVRSRLYIIWATWWSVPNIGTIQSWKNV